MRNSYEGGVWKKTIEGLLTMNNRRGSRNFSKGGGGGGGEKILKKKRFFNTGILVCTKKKYKNIRSCFFSFALFYYPLLFMAFERGRGGGLQPPYPAPS